MAKEQLVVIDEAGCNLSMTVQKAYAPIGERAYAKRLVNREKNISLIGAFDDCGMLTLRIVEGATNREKFVAFVKEALLPRLKEGRVVVMDNLRPHHALPIREAIEAAGAKVKYLPPYSPALNPIEPCWSKMKRSLRKAAARTLPELMTAIRKARASIQVEDALNWFRHCGYP